MTSKQTSPHMVGILHEAWRAQKNLDRKTPTSSSPLPGNTAQRHLVLGHGRRGSMWGMQYGQYCLHVVGPSFMRCGGPVWIRSSGTAGSLHESLYRSSSFLTVFLPFWFSILRYHPGYIKLFHFILWRVLIIHLLNVFSLPCQGRIPISGHVFFRSI